MTIQEMQKEKILTSKTDKGRSLALSMLISTAKKIAKEENRETTEADIVLAAKRGIKSLTSTIEQVKVGPIVEAYKKDVEIYKEFLPKMIDEDVLGKRIAEIVETIPEEERTMKSMGRVIGVIKKEYGDAADMSMVSKITKELLN